MWRRLKTCRTADGQSAQAISLRYGRLTVCVTLVLFALSAGCRSAKPPPTQPVHVGEAQRSAAQASKFSAEENWTAAANQWQLTADLYFLLNDRTNAAIALHNSGRAHHGAGDLRSAEETLAEAARINEELGRRKEWFRNYLILAQVAARARNTNALAERLESLSRRVGEIDDPQLKGTFHNEVGLWRLEQRRFPESADAFQRAAAYFKEAKDRHGMATVLANQAKAYERQKNYPAAMDSWQAALGDFQTLAHPEGIAHSLTGLGRTLLTANQDLPRAEDLLRRAVRNYRTLNKNRELQETEALLAKCLKAQGKGE